MVRQVELVEQVLSYRPDANEALINKAYVYAMVKHGPQQRASGEPYMSHPHAVAAILADMHADEATIIVALLHDTIEDTDATREDIEEKFGKEISELVEALTKLKKMQLVTQQAKQAENLRRFLIATAKDVRVLLVKLADRLHNMRTLQHMKDHKRTRIAQETMDIYAPLAGRMGMQDMREELEDLSFRYINPSGYATIVAKLKELQDANSDLVAKIDAALLALMDANNIKATVKSRQKRPWSVFRKMETKGISFDALPDIFGFRIMVEDVAQCYQALGAIHQTWSMVPGRFKDYISTQKQNNYQSIHTTVFGPSRQRIELQIRTHTMHSIAEFGIASHSLYKDGIALKASQTDIKKGNSGPFAWLQQTIDALADGENAEDFLEHTKLELFQDQVFTFTPKGRLIALPQGATPIDFAYAVHTDIGDKTIGARINGRTMPLMTELMNGDELEVVTSSTAKPPAAWEHIAKTGKARAAIRRATRTALREQYSGIGERILANAFHRAEKPYAHGMLQNILPKLGRREILDITTAVGRGELTSETVLKAVYPEFEQSLRVPMPKAAREEGWFNLRSAAGMLFKVPGRAAKNAKKSKKANEEELVQNALPIRGIASGAAVRFADEGAVPGDRIVGIIQPDQGIKIYPIHSESLAQYDDEPERWIDVRWDVEEDGNQRFPAQILVTAINAPGTLAKIAELIAKHRVNIHTMHMRRTAADFTEMEISVEVTDLRQLTGVIAALRELDCTSGVERASAAVQAIKAK